MVSAPLLASHLFQKGERGFDPNIPEAVEWLLRLLATRDTPGCFKAAIWGLSVDEEVIFPDSFRLIPFASMPNSYLKGRILDRARPCYDGSAWISHTYFDAPRAVLVKEVPSFPYIRALPDDLFRTIAHLEQKARDHLVLIEAASIGHPLAIGCWFEYAHRDLDFLEWQNTITWMLPEIPPRVSQFTPADMNAIQDNLRNYAAFPTKSQSSLLRSMTRFTLSQCRHQMSDRILDLALAFEVAVSEDGQNIPASWKVSVRSAQLIGGTLEKRQENRATISELYALRNKATHGSDLKSKSDKTVAQIVQESSNLYVTMMKLLLSFCKQPDWTSIELEPRTIK